MSFSEAAFVSLFLPVALAAGALVRGTRGYRAWHSMMGLLFLALAGWQQPLVFLMLIAGNAVIAYLPGRARRAAAVLFNVGAVVLSRMHLPVAVPLGLSYAAFQALSFHLDGEKAAPLDFAFYLLFFPKQPMGPLARYADLTAQTPEPAARWDDLARGLSRFVLGLAKKVLIADRLALLMQVVHNAPGQDRGPALALLGFVVFPLQLYMDFSGYSDMALGMARAMGFALPENFRAPFRADSIRDFWRRWHITLGAWMRDYVYIPLGGSRRGAWRTAANTLVVYVLIALWHGAGRGFLVWGVWNALWIIIERQGWLKPGRWRTWVRRLYVCTVSALGFLPFATGGLRAVFRSFGGSAWRLALAQLRPTAVLAVLAAVLVIALEGRGVFDRVPRPVRYLALLALAALCVTAVYGAAHVPFLYAAY